MHCFSNLPVVGLGQHFCGPRLLPSNNHASRRLDLTDFHPLPQPPSLGWRHYANAPSPPAWASNLLSAYTTAQQSPFVRLLPLLESPPTILSVVFYPPLPGGLSPKPQDPTDLVLLSIPTRVIGSEKLTGRGRRLHSFQNSFAYLSHDDPKEMSWSSRGWVTEENVRENTGEEGKDASATEGAVFRHLLIHAWNSRQKELEYKTKKIDHQGVHGTEYELFFLQELKKAEQELGMRWESWQIYWEPVRSFVQEKKKKRRCMIL